MLSIVLNKNIHKYAIMFKYQSNENRAFPFFGVSPGIMSLQPVYRVSPQKAERRIFSTLRAKDVIFLHH